LSAAIVQSPASAIGSRAGAPDANARCASSRDRFQASAGSASRPPLVANAVDEVAIAFDVEELVEDALGLLVAAFAECRSRMRP
jgi:hypothetical protein